MNISNKTDYSSLFGSLNSTESSGFSLNDYASIKNGSYGKLMKAYYKDQNSDGKTAKEVKQEIQNKGAEYSEISSLSDKFESTVDKQFGSSSKLFELKDVTKKDENGVENTTQEYDRDAIVSALKDFAKSYNDFYSKAMKSTNKNVARRAENMAGQMTSYFNQLKAVGIEMNEDATIKVNEDTVRKADVSALKRAFTGSGSMVSQIASKVSQIGNAAGSAANNLKGYNKSAKYASADAATLGTLLNDKI